MTTNALVSKIWSFCNTLRDDVRLANPPGGRNPPGPL